MLQSNHSIASGQLKLQTQIHLALWLVVLAELSTNQLRLQLQSPIYMGTPIAIARA